MNATPPIHAASPVRAAPRPILQDFRFSHSLRVRWAEVDMQKIVFNAHYLMYLDTAMADYWRALALPYETAMQALDGDLYVKKATIEYHASARYDDRLDVALRCARIGTSSITFEGAIFCSGQLLITGELLYVFADPATQKSKPVPHLLRELFLAYEDRQSVVTVKTGTWTTLEADAMQMRHRVFAQELQMPADLMSDAADDAAVHVVAYNWLGQAVATGRLATTGEQGVGKIGRMAASRVLRSGGLGGQVLKALEVAALQRGDELLTLSAQITAQNFYTRHGYTAQGPVFEEAGIKHLRMVKTVRAEQG